MAEYQLYSNGKIVTFIDVDSSSFKEEESQVLKQGFDRLGDVISAKDGKEALDKYGEYNGDEVKELTLLCVVSCLLS